jgi:hypothetical protein
VDLGKFLAHFAIDRVEHLPDLPPSVCSGRNPWPLPLQLPIATALPAGSKNRV